MEIAITAVVCFGLGLLCNLVTVRRRPIREGSTAERIAQAIRDDYGIPVDTRDVSDSMHAIHTAIMYKAAERAAGQREASS